MGHNLKLQPGALCRIIVCHGFKLCCYLFNLFNYLCTSIYLLSWFIFILYIIYKVINLYILVAIAHDSESDCHSGMCVRPGRNSSPRVFVLFFSCLFVWFVYWVVIAPNIMHNYQDNRKPILIEVGLKGRFETHWTEDTGKLWQCDYAGGPCAKTKP
jgi:hypothetical protein